MLFIRLELKEQRVKKNTLNVRYFVLVISFKFKLVVQVMQSKQIKKRYDNIDNNVIKNASEAS